MYIQCNSIDNIQVIGDLSKTLVLITCTRHWYKRLIHYNRIGDTQRNSKKRSIRDNSMCGLYKTMVKWHLYKARVYMIHKAIV